MPHIPAQHGGDGLHLGQPAGRDFDVTLAHENLTGALVFYPAQQLAQDAKARRHDAAGGTGVDTLAQHLDRERAADDPAQRRRRPQVVVITTSRVEADDESRPDAIGQSLDVRGQVRAAALLGRFDQHDAAAMRHALSLQRFDGGERRERGIAVVARAAPEQPVAATHGNPRPRVGGPAHHLRLLVAVAIEQHRVAAGARRLHQDDGRAAWQTHDLDGESFDLPAPRPVGDEADGALEVAVLRPVRVEHRRLGGDADVLGQGGHDVVVPGSLDEGACAVAVDGHGRV